jgi:hypothetical protein
MGILGRPDRNMLDGLIEPFCEPVDFDSSAYLKGRTAAPAVMASIVVQPWNDNNPVVVSCLYELVAHAGNPF